MVRITANPPTLPLHGKQLNIQNRPGGGTPHTTMETDFYLFVHSLLKSIEYKKGRKKHLRKCYAYNAGPFICLFL